MLNLDTDLLKQLELDQSHIGNLSVDKIKRKITNQYRKLSLQFHPDKTIYMHEPAKKLATQRFIEINHAYEKLIGIIEKIDIRSTYKTEIERFFDRRPLVVPERTFDYLLLENIEAAYENLKKEFANLTTDKQKQAFGTHYAKFLNLAQHLNEERDYNYSNRGAYLYEHENRSISMKITYEWRQLIVRLFAEEYLSDFEYRHAIATGELWTILATRKLFVPLKYVAAIFNGTSICFVNFIRYCYTSFINELLSDMGSVWREVGEGRYNPLAIGIIILKLAAVGLFLYGLFQYDFMLLFVGYSGDVEATPAIYLITGFGDVLECMASPVNRVIRPLANYTGFSPWVLTALFSTAGLALTSALFIAPTPFVAITVMLPYIALVANSWVFVELSKILLRVYEKEPTLAIFIVLCCVIVAYLSIPSLLVLNSIVLQMAEPVAISASFVMGCYFHGGNNWSDNINQVAEKKSAMLPLPNGPVEESIREATLLGCKKATQSSWFFNTPEHADCIRKEDRSFWQQASSFFGDGVTRMTKANYYDTSIDHDTPLDASDLVKTMA